MLRESVSSQSTKQTGPAGACDADEALKRLRQESQRRHVKVTEVATEVVAAYGSEAPAR